MTSRLASLLGRARDWCLGFFEIHAEQSMTRLCALVFAGVGVALAGTAMVIALRVPDKVTTIDALARFAAAYVAGGTVALLFRSRPDDPNAPAA